MIAQEAKAKGKRVLGDVEEPASAGRGSNVIDLMAALKASVDGKKTAPAEAAPAKKAPAGKRRRASAPEMARRADPLAQYEPSAISS